MKFSDDETVHRPSIERRNLDGTATIDVRAQTLAESEFSGGRGAGEGRKLKGSRCRSAKRIMRDNRISLNRVTVIDA